MLPVRLLARFASARVVGIARANGFDLSFAKRSRDGSGKAMLATSERDRATVHGVLFDLDATDLGRLDGLEGVGSGYRRENAFEVVTLPEGVVRIILSTASKSYAVAVRCILPRIHSRPIATMPRTAPMPITHHAPSNILGWTSSDRPITA